MLNFRQIVPNLRILISAGGEAAWTIFPEGGEVQQGEARCEERPLNAKSAL